MNVGLIERESWDSLEPFALDKLGHRLPGAKEVVPVHSRVEEEASHGMPKLSFPPSMERRFLCRKQDSLPECPHGPPPQRFGRRNGGNET